MNPKNETKITHQTKINSRHSRFSPTDCKHSVMILAQIFNSLAVVVVAFLAVVVVILAVLFIVVVVAVVAAAASVDSVALGAASVVVSVSAPLGNPAFVFSLRPAALQRGKMGGGVVGLVWTNNFRRCTRLLGRWHRVLAGNPFDTCPVALHA